MRQYRTEAVALHAAGQPIPGNLAEKIKGAQVSYKNFCKENGLEQRLARTTVSCYNKSVATATNKAFNKAAKSFYDAAAAREPAITATVKRIADDLQLDMPGLEYRLKSLDRFMEKANIEGGFSHIKDVVRYTYSADGDRLVGDAEEALASFKASGYRVSRINNYWLQTRNPYRGINTNLTDPTGQVFELQLHTPESLAVKEEMHKLYEEFRVLDPLSPKAADIQAQMAKMSKALKLPQEIERIGNAWPNDTNTTS